MLHKQLITGRKGLYGFHIERGKRYVEGEHWIYKKL